MCQVYVRLKQSELKVCQVFALMRPLLLWGHFVFLFRFSLLKLSMSSSFSCLISVCSVSSLVSVCSVKSVSVNKSSSSLKKSKGPKQVKIRFVHRFVQFSHSCSFCIRRYSLFCKLVKPGHHCVLRPRGLPAFTLDSAKTKSEASDNLKQLTSKK